VIKTTKQTQQQKPNLPFDQQGKAKSKTNKKADSKKSEQNLPSQQCTSGTQKTKTSNLKQETHFPNQFDQSHETNSQQQKFRIDPKERKSNYHKEVPTQPTLEPLQRR
jgi:hypothetical protein